MDTQIPQTEITELKSNELQEKSEANSEHSNTSKLKEEFEKFLKTHTVYETIPENMKILVFNNELCIKDAIEAMIKEDIYCGLIWDTELNKFIGIFTIRDFLNLIKVLNEKIITYLQTGGKFSSIKSLVNELFHRNKINYDELDAILEVDLDGMSTCSLTKSNTNQTNDVDTMMEESIPRLSEQTASDDSNLKNYKEFFKIFEHMNINEYLLDIHPDNCVNFNLISITLDGNLKECIDLMKSNRIHRVIIEDNKSNTFTGFITYETIFDYFVRNYYSDMKLFQTKITNLNIVTNGIISGEKNDTIFTCLEKFWFHKISILPIIDTNTNTVFGFFFLKDIVYFFNNGEKFSFADPISKFLTDLYDDVCDDYPLGKDRIIFNEEKDFDLKQTFEHMSMSPERKIFVKTSSEHWGIITLSDIFNILNL